MTIAQKQHLLAYLGYYTIPVDGVWGDGSALACMAFQADYGLGIIDGICGPDTEAALLDAVVHGMPNRKPVDRPGLPPADGGDWPDCPNFTRAEFACPCGCGFDEINHGLVRISQRVRDHFDAPFIPSSGCRCKAHNARVGGVYNSRHLRCKDGTGHAVDFCIYGHSDAEVDAYVATVPGVVYHYRIKDCNGRYTGYVHMDIGGETLEALQQIAAAWGVPSAIMGLLAWLLKRWIEKRDKAKEVREEERNKNRQQFEVNLIQSVNAAIALSEATARAVQRIPDAHCNGDMHAALEYAKSVKHGQKDFLTSLGIQALYDE